MSTQEAFSFPEPLAEKYRPRRIADFVGLEKPKKILAKLAESPYPSAWIFVGPSGTGKTTMALALAAAIPAELHLVPSQNCTLEAVERIRRTCQYVPLTGYKFHLVLVDEADRMSPAAQVCFLSKLDATDFPPNTIFVFTCNSTDGLEQRFLSRCRVLEFSSYGLASEAQKLLASIWEQETGSAHGPNFARIVKDSCNNVRDALMALEVEIMAA